MVLTLHRLDLVGLEPPAPAPHILASDRAGRRASVGRASHSSLSSCWSSARRPATHARTAARSPPRSSSQRARLCQLFERLGLVSRASDLDDRRFRRLARFVAFQNTIGRLRQRPSHPVSETNGILITLAPDVRARARSEHNSATNRSAAPRCAAPRTPPTRAPPRHSPPPPPQTHLSRART